jgi:3-deoxy-D-manno-octulosonic-acid transferase
MVFGPNMQNFSDVVQKFLVRNAAIQVGNSVELEQCFADLLGDIERRQDLGQNALAVFKENLGAIERTVDMIVKHLEGGELYVAPKRVQA